MAVNSHPLYTGEGEIADIRLVGALSVIVELADILHEYTPYLSALYHQQANEGIIFARIDAAQRNRLQLLQHRYGGGKERVNSNFVYTELLMSNPTRQHRFTHTFTLRDIAPAPYPEPISPLLFRLGAKPADTPRRKVFYRIVDTPEAAIGHLLAERMSVYSYSTRFTQLSYLEIEADYMKNTFKRLNAHFPYLALERRFALPYESTSEFSPIQRSIDIPDYF